MATPSYVNEGTAAQEAAPTTNLTPGLPASIVAGNFLLLVVVTRGTSADNTDPSGWTLLASAVETISNYTFKVYGRIATGSESAPSIAWTGGGTDFGQAHIFQYTDNDTTSVEAATEAVSAVANGADVSVELPSVTAGGSERLAIQVVSGRGTDGSPSASSSPGGNYSLNDSDFYNGANLTIAAYSASLAGGGTVSGESVSFTTANAWYAVGFALVGASDANEASGTPQAGAATADGSMQAVASADGTPQAQAADATGTLATVASLSGTPQAGAATSDGLLFHVALLSGSPQAGTATAAGTMGNQSVMSGAPQAGTATAAGALALIASLQGAAQADAAVSTGAATLIASMSGDAAAGFATADGFIDDGMAPTPVARRAPLMLVDVGRMMGR